MSPLLVKMKPDLVEVDALLGCLRSGFSSQHCSWCPVLVMFECSGMTVRSPGDYCVCACAWQLAANSALQWDFIGLELLHTFAI